MQREPVAYILGRKGFRRIELEVDSRVLIPRPETEHVVEAALTLPQGARVVDVGTGSGAIALALADERPDLRVVATDISSRRPRRGPGQRGAARIWRSSSCTATCWTASPARSTRCVSNPPYVAPGASLSPEIARHEPAVALYRRRRRARRLSGALVPASAGVPFVAFEVGAGMAGRGSGAALLEGRFERGRCAISPGSIGVVGRAAVTPSRSSAASRAGGVVVFPADTVYGLACDPENADAVQRLYALKGRAAGQARGGHVLRPRPRARGAARARRRARARCSSALLPGAVTLLLPTRDRFPLAAAGRDARSARARPAARSRGVARPVLQSSANLAGGPDARRLDDVPEAIRRGADLVLDGGELPGTPSTVVDLRDYEATGAWSDRARTGAVPEAVIRSIA